MADGSLATLSQGEHAVAPISQPARFSEGVSRHHRPFYDDYRVAKLHIMQALGDISEIELWGKQVAIAVFCRPNQMPIKNADGEQVGTFYLPVKEVKEDWYQHKAGLVISMGPSAFDGDDSYLRDRFRNGQKPKIGDWLFGNANAGVQQQWMGTGASKPQGVDHRGQPMSLFEWDGWPVRIIHEDEFFGRVSAPHSVV